MRRLSPIRRGFRSVTAGAGPNRIVDHARPAGHRTLTAVLLAFASLEAILGLCARCWLFGLLMKAGVIPDGVCEECTDLRRRYAEHGPTEQT
jgi:hypothetical protein